MLTEQGYNEKRVNPKVSTRNLNIKWMAMRGILCRDVWVKEDLKWQFSDKNDTHQPGNLILTKTMTTLHLK